MSTMEKVKGIAAVVFGAASFGILSTFVKKAYAQGFTLGEVTGIQALLGMLILWTIIALLFIFNRSYFSKYPSHSSKWVIIVSGFATGAVSILYYKSVQQIPASLAIVLLMQYIWIGQLIEFIFFRTIPTWRQVVGIIAILISTLLATGILEHDLAHIPWTGIVYGLLAGTAYALIIIINGRVGNDHPPLQKSALMIAGAFILVFVLLRPYSVFEMQTLRALGGYGLLLSVFGTVLPPALFAYGMPKIGFSLGSILSAVELPVAVCMSYLVLREEVTTMQFIGVACILSIVVFINLKRPTR